MDHILPRVVVCLGLAFVLGLDAADRLAADEPAPPAAAPAEPIDQLIRQLGDKDFHVRQRAQDALGRRGFEAFDALNAAATDEDLEIASRAKYLLRLMRVEWATEGDPPEVRRCLRDYEFEGLRSRIGRMQALAGLPNGQGVVALCRLVRFEKSLLLSKTAALALLSGQRSAAPPSPAIVEAARKALGDSKRSGAAWILAWTRLAADPQTVLTQWTKLVDDEQALLQPADVARVEASPPIATTPEIVAGLIRFQITQWKRLGKVEEATAAMRRLVQIEPGKPESLAELLEWLTEQQAWKAIDELHGRFAEQFATEPGLLYALADAREKQGNADQAEQTAKQAFALNPGKEAKDLFAHISMAQHLQRRGQTAWARREYEHVIQQGADADSTGLRTHAQYYLADMLHDRGEDLDAAETLAKLVQAIEAGKVTDNELGGRRAEEVRARMNYFFACHWQSKQDIAKQQEYLDKALKADPEEVDVLIACYQLPDQSKQQRAKVVDSIAKVASDTRELIAQAPDDFTAYNQFAWLIGNTEGDFDEALRYSEKSIELNPNEGGLYDTLAHVYFAKGDLDNAVKSQERAAELDPHSGLIRRKLDFFRQKREEKQKP